MKFPAGLLLLSLALAGCAASTRHDLSGQMADIRFAGLSRVPLATIQQIADARGGKDDGEIWLIDRHRGDIRIRKTWPAQPHKADTELWHLAPDGTWTLRP
jgi:hypothetical protein